MELLLPGLVREIRGMVSLAFDKPQCYRGNVTKITQMVPEYSPQRGKGVRTTGVFVLIFDGLL